MAAIRAAQLGKKVAVIEKQYWGGVCLNVGCIPTKMYVYAADVALAARTSERLGVSAHVDAVDWDGIVSRVFHNRIDQIAQGGEAYRRGDKTPNITVFDQHARFIGPKTLQVGNDVVTGDQIVIATGARPNIPPVVTDSGVPYETSDTIMRIEKLPRSLVIAGAGYIALEFAHVFSSLGVEVTMLARGKRVLRHADDDVSRVLTHAATDQWALERDAVMESIEQRDGTIRVTLRGGRVIEGEMLLVATGRIPNTDDLGLENTRVEVRDDGRIVVDEYGRTGADGVWSLGDCSSRYQLKHVANAEERCVAHNLVHPNDLHPFPHDVVPSAVFTHPQMAQVGQTEAEAKRVAAR